MISFSIHMHWQKTTTCTQDECENIYNHKFSHGQKKMHEQYIQQLLTTIATDPFHGPA